MAFWAPDIDPGKTPHHVVIHRGEFTDESRDGRAVPFKIYYPVNHGMTDLPVIVWSHGLGGSRDGAAFLARFMASHGYVLVHLTHPGTDTSLWEGKPGHAWDNIRNAELTEDIIMHRFEDVPFALNQLPALKEENPEVGCHMDLSRLGMSGHSLGAFTTQIMAGQLLERKFCEEYCDMREKRFKAAIAYSMFPGHGEERPPNDIYGPIAIPMFHMTGTEDLSPLSGDGYEWRLPVFQYAGGPDQHLLTLQDGDHMIFAGSRGKLDKNPKRHIHEDILKIASLAFWDSYLKDDENAKHWLTAGALDTWMGEEASYTYRNQVLPVGGV